MAHKAQNKWLRAVKAIYPKFFHKTRVLEIGSLNVNGTMRDLFRKCEYVGVDIREGNGVDIVCKGHEFKDDNLFDVVSSGECFEHDEHYALTINNMYNHLKPGGLMMFTCAGTGRREHGTRRSKGGVWGSSPDYYKNLTADDIKDILDVNRLFDIYSFWVNNIPCDLYFCGIKIAGKEWHNVNQVWENAKPKKKRLGKREKRRLVRKRRARREAAKKAQS